MRLTDYEVEMILKAFSETFRNGKVYLYGSRVDDTRKGGDIDLYVVPSASLENVTDRKLDFVLKLESLIGEQKIDVLIQKDTDRDIEKNAMEEGILLNTRQLRIEKYLQECEKHIYRIQKAFDGLQKIFPISAEKYELLNDQEVALIDQYLFRFSKLQDTIGEKLFRLIVGDYVEDIESLSFIDILNRLEKIHVLEDSQVWKRLRIIRNEISQQYDDNPVETADMINRIFAEKDVLIGIYLRAKKYFDKKY